MKKFYLPILLGLAISTFFVNDMISNVNGPPAGNAGEPGGTNCGAACHAVTPNIGPGTASITTDVPGTGYVPGTTYTVTVSIDQAGLNKYGFQALAGYSATSSKQEGTVTVTDAAQTATRTNPTGTYVTHNSTGATGIDSKSWSFDWTAPVAGTGTLTFYAALNAANNNGQTSGDDIYTVETVVDEMVVGVAEEIANAFIVYPTVADQQVTVKAEDNLNGDIYLNVFDLNGKQMYSYKGYGSGAGFSKTLDVSTWDNGVYILHTIADGKMENTKIVKY